MCYTLPKIFTRAVLALSPINRDGFDRHCFEINGIKSFQDLKDTLSEYENDDDFNSFIDDFISDNLDYLETYSGDINNVKKAMLSYIKSLSNSNSVDELVSKLLSNVEKLGIDFNPTKEGNEKSSVF
jgi:hypothetical protein